MIWQHVDEHGFPPCDSETVFVGMNSAGFCGCFNEHGLMSTAQGQRSVCLYATPEGCDEVMTDLEWWAVLDVPSAQSGHGSALFDRVETTGAEVKRVDGESPVAMNIQYQVAGT